ncbi:unnamed protein product [Mucor hiemalis]
MSSNHNFISLTSVSNLRLEHFETQHELARNFYDDHEFCPVYQVEEVAEHRERIQKRTSPYPSPSHSPPSYYISPKQQRPQLHSHHSSSTSITRAIPIIDPSNMTPVSVPSMQQQHYVKASSTSPSMTQWSAYKNNSTSTSPRSSNSSICSMSSSSSSSSSSSGSNTATSPPNHHLHQNSITNHNNHPSYYYGNNNCSIPATTIHYNNHYHYQQPQMMPIVARAIPIIDPATRQVYRQQQQTPNIPPGFYNVSVC